VIRTVAALPSRWSFGRRNECDCDNRYNLLRVKSKIVRLSVGKLTAPLDKSRTIDRAVTIGLLGQSCRQPMCRSLRMRAALGVSERSQAHAQRRRQVGGLQGVVWPRFGIRVPNAAVDFVVLGHFAGKLVEERRAGAELRKQQGSLLHPREDRSDRGLHLFPKSRVATRLMTGRCAKQRKQPILERNVIVEEAIEDAAVAAPAGRDSHHRQGLGRRGATNEGTSRVTAEDLQLHSGEHRDVEPERDASPTREIFLLRRTIRDSVNRLGFAGNRRHRFHSAGKGSGTPSANSRTRKGHCSTWPFDVRYSLRVKRTRLVQSAHGAQGLFKATSTRVSCMFHFKKFVSPLFFPVPVCLLILTVGLALLWFTRKQKAGKILASTSFILLVVLSYNWVSGPLLRSLEQHHRPFLSAPPNSEIKWVVVIGAGTSSDASIPLTSRLSQASLARIIEGVRLQKQIPGSKLIVSAGSVYGSGADAEAMFELAKALGVAPTDIVTDAVSLDTETQARIIKETVVDDQFVLVTSASHMRRAVALFKQAGLDPIPAPTHYLAQVNEGTSPSALYPSSAGIHAAEIAAYEYLGMLWAELRGKM